MLRHRLAAAAFVASMIPAAASAQDGAPDRPEPLSAGFRVEGLIGYEHAAFDSVTKGEGLLYGVGLGYDFAHKRLRFGLEAEATDSTAKKCVPLIGGTGNVCLRTSRDLYVGGRIGVEASRGVLLYGKAGYSNYGESNRYPPSIGSIVTHPHFDGIRVGAGAEVAIGRSKFVKAEYRYSAYERSQDFDKHQAVIGFGFRF